MKKVSDKEQYAEERIPFDAVLRKLVSTKPPHKTTPAPTKRTKAPKKP